jgi:hypothetical protein
MLGGKILEGAQKLQYMIRKDSKRWKGATPYRLEVGYVVA